MVSTALRFELGCDINEFRHYYESIREKLTALERMLIQQDPDHLIVWRENNEIAGHALWHEASTDEHRKNDPRDSEDQTMLRKLFEGKTDLVELHEVWLKKEYRGKGYGTQFFEFFEHLMREKRFTEVAYYAYHPAALAICRHRGYKEICCLQQPGLEGNIENTHIFRLIL
jgi:GNAT superfamily N-acetyltransferase